MTEYLNKVNELVWGIPLLVLIIGCGLYYSFQTGFVQIRMFPRALRAFCRQLRRTNKEDESGIKALCTALSATVGTGNIAGVAGAIALGGPGSLFWMWIFAFLGMVIKFSEATLSVCYRQGNQKDGFMGGPMYIIKNALGRRWHILAGVYSFLGLIAAFGVGNATQIHTAITGINGVLSSYGKETSVLGNLFMGIAAGILVAFSLKGGAKRIGNIAQALIPFACIGYILMCLIAIFLRMDNLHCAIISIIKGAFTPYAVTSGALGSAFIAMRIGASRGLFTNEAGMGTAAIAHATAHVSHPVEQGLMGIVEVYLDTMVICTLTGLVILTSNTTIPYGTDPSLNLTVQAFAAVLGKWSCIPICIFLCLFAYATILGWGLYGMCCTGFLLGEKAAGQMWKMQVCIIILSSLSSIQTVWLLSETMNGLMAVPNLIMLILLCPKLRELIYDYKNIPPKMEGYGLRRNLNNRPTVAAEVFHKYV